jgi:hypothetical protein
MNKLRTQWKKVLTATSVLVVALAVVGTAQVNQALHSVTMSEGQAYHTPPHLVQVVARHADGTEFYRSKPEENLRTNAGANWQADIMSDTGTPSVNTQCNYIALTDDSGSPNATDTALASEIATNGLSRKQGTYNHTSNASSYTDSAVWTATGTQASQKAGMLTTSSGGTLCFESTYTAVTLNDTDTLTLTWTINF